MSGIYIHIPFCKQACSYCDFYFVTRDQLKEPFLDSLIEEIKYLGKTEYSEEPTETIYIGGGTPSLLTLNQIEKIFKELEASFKLRTKEVTIELNPDDVTPEYLRGLKDLGVNRASMGIQSFHPELLRFMNRAHTSDEAEYALDSLHKAGFTSFTVDLIYGNPGQTEEMLREDIKRLLKHQPPHISAYSLTIEPNTRLGKQVDLGRIKPPNDDLIASHFDIVIEELEKAGIHQYEVSNFSLPGKEALHNSNYWKHKNYLGLGPAAHSFWKGESGTTRWQNKRDISSYIEEEPKNYQTEIEILGKSALAEERLFLGLRTKWGVDLNQLSKEYEYEFNTDQREWVEGQKVKGIIIQDGNSIKLSRDGLKIADLLLVDLLSKQ